MLGSGGFHLNSPVNLKDIPGGVGSGAWVEELAADVRPIAAATRPRRFGRAMGCNAGAGAGGGVSGSEGGAIGDHLVPLTGSGNSIVSSVGLGTSSWLSLRSLLPVGYEPRHAT